MVRCIINPSFIKIQSVSGFVLYVTHMTNSVHHGGVHSFVTSYSYGLNVSLSLRWSHVIVVSLWGTKHGNFWCNIRMLDRNVCVCVKKDSNNLNSFVFNFPSEIKHCVFSLFPWERFALDIQQRHCRGGGQWGRWRAGRQQVMCLPPECLHMLCVGEFMAVPLLPRIPYWPGVRGHHGALYSWPAGPAQPCHPPAEKESNTHTHAPACT